MDKKKLALFAFVIPVGVLTAAAPAAAQDSMTLNADLAALNDSGVSGTGMVMIEGTRVTVDIDSSGLLAGAPHAQHFHIGGENMCPTMDAADDIEDDERLSTSEGKPAYGGIKTSLTTEGDTSPDSALAVERMPAADDDGNVSYHREFDVPADVASSIKAGEAVIVQHGIDYNDNGKYDMDGGGESDLNPDLPAEATDPVSCGRLMPAPDGGMAAGAGGTADSGINAGMLGVGALLLAAASWVFFAGRRRLGRSL